MHELSQQFMFEAAHTLDREYETERSQRVHGHTYFAEITIAGSPNPRTGMIVDLAKLRAGIERVRLELDHRLLDDITELGPATLENLCTFIRDRLVQEFPNLVEVTVWRPGSGDRCRLNLRTT